MGNSPCKSNKEIVLAVIDGVKIALANLTSQAHEKYVKNEK